MAQFKTIAKRAVLSVAVLALVLTSVVESRAQQGALGTKLANTKWMQNAQEPDGSSVKMVIAFGQDGGFQIVKMNAQGKVLAEVKGKYELVGQQAKFYVNGQLILNTNLSFNGKDTLISSGGNRLESWARMKC